MLTEICNTSWEGEIKNQGDTINIRTAPSITINDYAGAGTTLTNEVPTPITQAMQINKGKYFSVQVNDVLAHQADMDLMNTFTEDAAKQLKISIENEVFFNQFVTEGAAAQNKGATAGALSSGYNLVLMLLQSCKRRQQTSLPPSCICLPSLTSRTYQKMAAG